MSTFNMESEMRTSFYSAPEIEIVKLEASSAFLKDSGVDGGGDAGEGGDGGEF